MKKIKLLATILATGILSASLTAGCGKAETVKAAGAEETAVTEETETAAVEEAVAAEEVTATENTAEDDIVVRIGQLSGHLLPVVALENGYFEEEGVKVELFTFGGGPAEIEAYTAGELDIIETGDLPFLNGISNGLDLHVIGTYSNSTKVNGLVATIDSGIKDYQDLKGKRLAVPFGTNIQALLYQYLELGGLTPEDAEILNLSNPDAVNALASGDIDAAVLWNPHLGKAAALENTVLISNTDEIRTFVCPISTSQQFIDEHHDTVGKTLRALNKASEFSKTNPEEAAQIVNDYYGLDSVDSILSELGLTDNSVPLTEEKIDALREGFAANYKYGLIENEYNIDDFIYAEFSDELSK